MSRSRPQKLVRVKQLIDMVKFDEANKLIKEFEEIRGHNLYDIILCDLLKCNLLFYQGYYEDVVKLTEKTYEVSLELGKNLLTVDILLKMAAALLETGQWDKSYDIINQGEELLITLTLELPADYKQREAYIAFLKGSYYQHKNEIDQAIKQFELSISIREELGVKMEIVWPLLAISSIFLHQNIEFDRASKYLERGLILANESGNKMCIGFCLYNLAYFHLVKGDFNRSIMLYEQSLTIFNETNLKIGIARVHHNLGGYYIMKGELIRSIRFFEESLKSFKELNYKPKMADVFNDLAVNYKMGGELDRAVECIEQSIALNHELLALRKLANNYDYLIQILIDRGDFKQARMYLSNLEQLNSHLKDKEINFMYLFDKAYLLKVSSRALNRGKAEEIFKQLLEEENLVYEIRLMVLIHLCELLLDDLQRTNEIEILEEIKPLITQLLDFSENSHSFWILGETYLLQAKLALINFDMKAARRLLTKAQKIAESYGIKRLAIQISHEHDELLKQVKMWEKLKDLDAPLSERWKLANLNEQIEKMARKRMKESPKISEEDPFMLLILTEGGNLLFSRKFVENFNFEDDILGGFLTTINYFIVEVFSEGLDRAVFGQYTLLMMPLQPFLICYIFKGDSYYAHQKIKSFHDSIQNDNVIWKSLQKFYQDSKSVQSHSIPLLESLITEIFIEKKK